MSYAISYRWKLRCASEGLLTWAVAISVYNKRGMSARTPRRENGVTGFLVQVKQRWGKFSNHQIASDCTDQLTRWFTPQYSSLASGLCLVSWNVYVIWKIGRIKWHRLMVISGFSCYAWISWLNFTFRLWCIKGEDGMMSVAHELVIYWVSFGLNSKSRRSLICMWASHGQFDAIFLLQSLTKPRLNAEVGNLSLIAYSEIPFGIQGCKRSSAIFSIVIQMQSLFRLAENLVYSIC